ncbi:MAG: DNA translocase FtsK 4TM domain-containing protein [Bacteroidia bacterium]
MTKYDKDLRSRGKVVDDFENELKPSPKPKPGNSKTAKAKSKGEPSFTAKDIGNVITLKDDTTRKIFGILLVCFSLFSAAALISFALYWKTDLSILQGEVTDPFQVVNNFEIKNWMGVLGANFGYIVMYKGFGLLSLLAPVFTMHFGLLLLVDKKILNPLKWMKYLATAGIWFMLASGSMFHSFSPVWGGGVGFWMFDSMREMVGLFGALLILAVTAYTIMWLVFNYEPIGIKNYAQKIIPGMTKAEPKRYEDNDTQIYAGDTLFEKDRIELDNFDEEDETQEFSFTIVDEKGKKKEIPLEPELALEVTETEEAEEEPPFEVEETKEPVADEHYGIDTPFDPKLDLRDYQFPEIDFLNDYGGEGQKEVSMEELEKSKNMIVETLKNYNISISSIKATTGPTVTLFEIVPSAGIKISRIKNLEDDIALSLAALGIRIIAPIPGKGTIGIEVPNKNPKIVSMKSMLLSPKFQKAEMDLPVCLGKTISNEVFVSDLTKMPHLLMAGATGQGKSVGLNALLISLLYKKHPAELKFVLVDPKKVELTLFRTIERHYLAKLPGDSEAIITDNKQVITTLKSLCLEMDSRYELLQWAMVRNIKEYNAKFISRKLNPTEGHRFLPYIVVIIDEVADLIMTAGKEVEHPISRLAQLARAIGIHLVLATQRPSVNIITGTIKANFPARIAFRVTSKIDSRTILDANGADQLVGRGDMLFSNGNDLIRLQCPFVDTPEVEKITTFIGSQRGYSQAYVLPKVADEDGEIDMDDMAPDDWDSMFEDAARVIVNSQQGSTSLLQRKMKIGYNRAGRLIDQMEIANIVGPFKGSQAREVLIKDETSLEYILQEILKK